MDGKHPLPRVTLFHSLSLISFALPSFFSLNFLSKLLSTLFSTLLSKLLIQKSHPLEEGPGRLSNSHSMSFHSKGTELFMTENQKQMGNYVIKIECVKRRRRDSRESQLDLPCLLFKVRKQGMKETGEKGMKN